MAQPKVNILVLEDQDEIRLMLKDSLEDAGFEVQVAASGEEALAQLDGVFDLAGLVTDIDVGPETSGWQVARHARELHHTIAVVYMSGAHGHEWAALGVPKSVMLSKPFAPAQVVTALSNLLNTSDV